MDPYAVDVDACRGRQRRLIEVLNRVDAEMAILTGPEMIQWATGVRFGPFFTPVAAIGSDGHVTLVVPERRVPEPVAADDVRTYQAQWHSTMRNDQRAASAQVLLDALPATPQRIGVEFSNFPPHLAQGSKTEPVDIEPALFALRRVKDADEIRMLRKAIAATEKMYAKARQIIEPGINELDVYSKLHEVGVAEFREPMTYFGQDFQCNSRGGPPRDRTAQAGELYILDLGAGFRGYYSDNARTISVDGKPTDEQMRAWHKIGEVFAMVESTVQPGSSAKSLFEQAQAILDECRPWEFSHHLGHGIGLFPHEAPHLNPHWDDTFQAGEVFTVEPGLYHDDLRHGMRLEHNYLVTENGIELLTDFALEL